MPLQEDANAYYASILDDAVRNPNKYSGSEDSIQHFGNLLEKSYYKPQKNTSYYESEAKKVLSKEVLYSENEESYGYDPSDFLEESNFNWVKEGYNRSLTGMVDAIQSGQKRFDMSGYEPGIVADLAATVISFAMPVDLASTLIGGGVGGILAKGATKKVAVGSIKGLAGKEVAKETVDNLVEKGAQEATELLVSQNVNRTVAERAVKKASKIVTNRVADTASKGAGQLGFHSGLQSVLKQEIDAESGGFIKGIQEGDVSLALTLKDASQGALFGGLTGATGQALSKYFAKNSKAPKTYLQNVAQQTAIKSIEATEIGLLSPIIYEDRAPTPQDFAQAFGTVGMLHVTRKLASKTSELMKAEKPMMTTQEAVSFLAEAKMSRGKKSDIFTSRDGQQIKGVKITTTEKGVDKVTGSDPKTKNKIEMTGSDFIDQGFARSSGRVKMKSSADIEASRRREIFGTASKFGINPTGKEFHKFVIDASGGTIIPKKGKSGYSQLTPIQRVKLLDSIRKKKTSDLIYKTLKDEGFDDYLLPKSVFMTKYFSGLDAFRQTKNRANTIQEIKTFKEIDMADARGATKGGQYLQMFQEAGLYEGGLFSRIFGNYNKDVKSRMDKLKLKNPKLSNREITSLYYRDLGTRLQNKNNRGDADVQRIRKVLNIMYKDAKKDGVPVKVFEDDYFPGYVKPEVLSLLQKDILKLTKTTPIFLEDELHKKRYVLEIIKDLVNGKVEGLNEKTKEAIIYIANGIGKDGKFTREESLARALMRVRDNITPRLYNEVGFLEKARTNPLPPSFYERDARVVLTKYATDTAKRSAQVKYFGAKSEVITDRINSLASAADVAGKLGDTKKSIALNRSRAVLEQTFASFTNLIENDPKKNLPPYYKNMSNWLVDFEVATKIGLGYATIPNVTQTAISTAIKAGYWNTFKGGYKLATDSKYRTQVKASGLNNLSVFQMMSGLEPSDTRMGRIANAITRVSGFQGINKFNQYLGAAAGREYIRTLVNARDNNWVVGQRWRKNWARQNLERLGLSRDLTMKDLKTKQGMQSEFEAIYRFSRDAQLQKNVLNDALIFNDPRFRPLFLFKKFGYKQFNWIREELVSEAKSGNILPMLRLGVGGFFGAQFVNTSKKALNYYLAEWHGDGERKVYDENRLFLPGVPKGTILDNIDYSELTYSDYLDMAASVGAFGFITDIIASENKLRALEFLFKPAIIQDGMKGVEAFVKIGKDTRDYGIGAVKRMPKYIFPIFGTVPRRLAFRLETAGQKEQYRKTRKGAIRQRILDAFIKGNEKEGLKLIYAWNNANPYNMLYYEDYGVDAIYERLEYKAKKRAMP
tara:strand:+ start:8394 stop:12377 length:3984 start_codon:yes stop_codon:yes gene_type:complete